MRISPRFATLVAALSFSFIPAQAAFATDGGGTTPGGGSASTEQKSATDATTPPATGDGTAADPVVTRTVALTKSQTKSVQRRVRVKPDGALGSGTRRAIKRYQRVQALTLTGAPNVETLRKMGLKIADKIEAKLRATADDTVSTADVSAPSSGAAAAIEAARSAIGTPYKSAGTTLAGFDCSGLTQWAFKKAGITLPRTSFDQFTQGVSVAKADIQPGDLVFFDSAGSGASHVGVATSATTVISATTRGVMDHTFASGYWASHYVGARRVGTAVKAAAAKLAG